ncbi:MAG: hypothetical protein ABI158_09670 [Edaphobacter sp.]
MPKATYRVFVLISLFSTLPCLSQMGAAPPTQNQKQSQDKTQSASASTASVPEQVNPQNVPGSSSQTNLPNASDGTIIDKNLPVLKQSPRIMGVLPNFTAVNSNTQLPRLTTRQKFVLAMHDSTDYSSFLLAGALAAKGLQSNATPQLGSGAAGFGRYYWRELADQSIGTFFTEAILPTLTREDPRYYTYGKDGFWRRSYYAVSRTFITKNDAGGEEFNISEIGGNAAEAGLSNLYYPSEERGFNKTAKNFATQTAITAGANVLKEFWPDIRKNVFRIRDSK